MNKSELAALSERQGRLKQAKRLWAEAKEEADTREHAEYCSNRERFCKIWSDRK